MTKTVGGGPSKEKVWAVEVATETWHDGGKTDILWSKELKLLEAPDGS